MGVIHEGDGDVMDTRRTDTEYIDALRQAQAAGMYFDAVTVEAMLERMETLATANLALSQEVELLRNREQLSIEVCAMATEPKLKLREAEAEITRLQKDVDAFRESYLKALRDAATFKENYLQARQDAIAECRQILYDECVRYPVHQVGAEITWADAADLMPSPDALATPEGASPGLAECLKVVRSFSLENPRNEIETFEQIVVRRIETALEALGRTFTPEGEGEVGGDREQAEIFAKVVLNNTKEWVDNDWFTTGGHLATRAANYLCSIGAAEKHPTRSLYHWTATASTEGEGKEN